MPCTTILVGKNATYDGSTMIARNDDAGGNDHFTPKKMIVVQPKEQPRVWKRPRNSSSWNISSWRTIRPFRRYGKFWYARRVRGSRCG